MCGEYKNKLNLEKYIWIELELTNGKSSDRGEFSVNTDYVKVPIFPDFNFPSLD